MNIEDLFKYGVTPKAGKNAGKRFQIAQIDKDGALFIIDWETGFSGGKLEPGEYDVWREPKTLFEDVSIVATLGNLKKAIEKAGLGDDTRIKTAFPGFFVDSIQDATAKIIEIDGKKAILFY